MGDIPGDFMDFAHIKNLIEKRETDRIHEFNLMLVGETGVGKSTLVKSLFKGKIKPEETNHGPKICEYSELLEENGVRLQLVCIETSNFDTHDNNEYVRYIDEQFKSYFVARRRQAWWNIKDTRIHCCLYLIPPYGKMKLNKEDLDCMKALHEKVNLVPIIAKADTFDTQQLSKFKENIIRDLELNGIKYFEFQFDPAEDEERSKLVQSEVTRFPFAIVAADELTHDRETKKVLWLRRTRAGDIDILDKTKSDFSSLSKLLIRHCMMNLIYATYEKHYSKYRRELLGSKDRVKLLESIGLKKHEIERIEYDINPMLARKPLTIHDINRERSDMEQKLAEMRLKVKHLKTMNERNAKPF